MGNRTNGSHNRYEHRGDEEHSLPPWQINIWPPSAVPALQVRHRKQPSVFALALKLNIPQLQKTGCCSSWSNRLPPFSVKYKLAGSLFVKVNVSLVSWTSNLSFLGFHHGPAHYNIEYNSISHNTVIFIIIIIIIQYHSSLHSSIADHALLIRCSAKTDYTACIKCCWFLH